MLLDDRYTAAQVVLRGGLAGDRSTSDPYDDSVLWSEWPLRSGRPCTWMLLDAERTMMLDPAGSSWAEGD